MHFNYVLIDIAIVHMERTDQIILIMDSRNGKVILSAAYFHSRKTIKKVPSHPFRWHMKDSTIVVRTEP